MTFNNFNDDMRDVALIIEAKRIHDDGVFTISTHTAGIMLLSPVIFSDILLCSISGSNQQITALSSPLSFFFAKADGIYIICYHKVTTERWRGAGLLTQYHMCINTMISVFYP